MGSGFALKKLNEARNARGHRSLAVDGVPIPLGLSHSETTPTTEVEAVTTNGELRHTPTSDQASSIASAFKRRKEAHSVKEHAAHVLDGAEPGAEARLGPATFATTPTTEVAAAATLGRLSFEKYMTSAQCVECASKRQRAAPSAKVPAQVAVDGLQARILPGLYPFEMIPIIEVEAVLIIGIWTAPSHVAPSFVHLTPHALVEGYNRFIQREGSLVKCH